MKHRSRWTYAFRGLLLGAAALALYLPAQNLQQKTPGIQVAAATVTLPSSIRLASAQTSWQGLLSARY
ncbi:MAG: hypothetical protein RR718_03825 [Comamonas sp.]